MPIAAKFAAASRDPYILSSNRLHQPTLLFYDLACLLSTIIMPIKSRKASSGGVALKTLSRKMLTWT